MSDLVLSMRPQSFDDMIGVSKLVAQIRGHFAHKHVPKAWMFSGQTGSGKTTIARIMANSLQCRHVEEFGSPCSKCKRHTKYFDIVEINASDITGIDPLRDALEGYTYVPKPGSRRRIYILDEAHQLSKHAQNLLLKYTEDCPRTTNWIFCTTEPDKLLRTLRRRCIVYQVPSLGLPDIKKLVKLGLSNCGSDKSSFDLAEKLLEKHITSPGLIVRAVQKYADTDMTADEASNVELGTQIDTSALCSSVVKGSWEDVAKHLMDAAPEDMVITRASVQGYLKSILLGDTEFSHRTEMLAKAILQLHSIRDEVPAVSAVLYKITKQFSRNKR